VQENGLIGADKMAKKAIQILILRLLETDISLTFELRSSRLLILEFLVTGRIVEEKR
jgi:hypothetical protein